MYWVIVFAYVWSVSGVQLYVHTGVRKTSFFVLCGEAFLAGGKNIEESRSSMIYNRESGGNDRDLDLWKTGKNAIQKWQFDLHIS